MCSLPASSTSRENRYFAKYSGLSSIEHSPALQLTRSSEGLDGRPDIVGKRGTSSAHDDNKPSLGFRPAQTDNPPSPKTTQHPSAESSTSSTAHVQSTGSSRESRRRTTRGPVPMSGKALLKSWKQQRSELHALRNTITGESLHSHLNDKRAGGGRVLAFGLYRGSRRMGRAFARFVENIFYGLTMMLAMLAVLATIIAYKLFGSSRFRDYIEREIAKQNEEQTNMETRSQQRCIMDWLGLWDPRSGDKP